MSFSQILALVPEALWESIYVAVISTAMAYVIGLPLGLVLVVTAKDGIRPMRGLNMALGGIVNFLRSVPFLILFFFITPFTRLVVGTSVGSPATIVPLVISAFPFVARMVEQSVKEVDRGVIEASQSMGASNWQIIAKVLLPEALPSLVNGAAISITTILGYTALASTIGGGGLGTLAIVKGLNIRKYDMMYSASLMLVFLVQFITVFGTRTTRSLDHKHR